MSGKRKMTEYRQKYLNLAVTEARRKLKAKAVAYKGGKCTSCGFKGYPAIFDFHHPDPKAKDFPIAGSCKSFERIKPELDKTVLLCANCHRKIHEEIFSKTLAERKKQLKLLAPTSW
jgi:predicted HNH restriction endonuclease